MTDDKTKRDQRDRTRVAGDEEYEVGHLASRHGLTLGQARSLIETHGNDRDELDAAARHLKTQDAGSGSS